MADCCQKVIFLAEVICYFEGLQGIDEYNRISACFFMDFMEEDGFFSNVCEISGNWYNPGEILPARIRQWQCMAKISGCIFHSVHY